jgi:predicted PurR-regulated permease PerM
LRYDALVKNTRERKLMTDMQRDMIGSLFSLVVIAVAAFIMQRFFLPLVWAGILCIATFPLHRRVLARCGGRPIAAAVLMTALMACIFLVPALLALRQGIEEAPAIATFVAGANNDGLAAPAVLGRIPMVGDYINHWWLETLAQPHGLTHLFSEGSVGHMVSPSGVLKALGTQLFHRLVDFGFAFLCLFFFYMDGVGLSRQFVKIGGRWFGAARWQHYYEKIPTAIRATVNGLVLVGLGEGVLIGIGYAIAGVPSPIIWGAITGVLAIVPFGAPVVYLCAAGLLAADGHAAAAIGVAVWGTLVLFVADHMVRPTVIGNATRLPFLAVLFGILGGVETLGLVGLFIGPVVMVLMVTLWREAGEAHDEPGQAEAL